ncbi:adenylate/guanylate cyclase domain-containing protein [Methylobacterium sp. ID0610]|uniref:adenylate/guanylate cyclase domain-containing protein n=1 Tax=Methylobacterium carpenticola TaxID=3344827 RepID=UPI00367F52FC
MTDDLLRCTGELARSTLAGASETDLLARFCEELRASGIPLSRVEVGCDALSAACANRFFCWRPGRAVGDGSRAAAAIFRRMLAGRLSRLRAARSPGGSGAETGPPAVFGAEGVTEFVAFATHLEPDATLGPLDDVMTLFATARPGGFGADEIAFLERIVPFFALALSTRLNLETARTLFDTYLGPHAAAALLAGRARRGAVRRIRAVVLYCDLVGFTGLTEQVSASDLIATLNRFFDAVTQPIVAAGGHVSGHVGDAAVMYCPIRSADDMRAVCAAAVRAATLALDAVAGLAPCGSGRGLRARIGIDVGEVVHGNIGSADRFSFTIIGDPVNRAARLQELAKELGVSLLMTGAVAGRAGIASRSYGLHVLRGSDRTVEVVGLPAPAPEGPSAGRPPAQLPRYTV